MTVILYSSTNNIIMYHILYHEPYHGLASIIQLPLFYSSLEEVSFIFIITIITIFTLFTLFTPVSPRSVSSHTYRIEFPYLWLNWEHILIIF